MVSPDRSERHDALAQPIAALTLLAKLAGLVGGFMLGGPLVALGYLVEYVAWTVGFGAAILVAADWQRGRRTSAGPATPPPAEPAAV